MSGGFGPLVEFSFVSTAVTGLPLAAVVRLAKQSWSFNTRMEITGEIRFANGSFEQTTEGPCDVLLALASRILTDRRHKEITVRRFRPIAARRFSAWTATGLGLRYAGASLDFAAADNLRTLPGVAASRAKDAARIAWSMTGAS